tara:strand:- start:1147 stop:1761 length:615 start_codon:yes stop_codon:yes gene_type:complete
MIHNLKNKMSVEYLQGVIEGMGYSFFTKGNYNVNIIGVRNPNLVANSFDDTMICAYKVKDQWVLKEWQITTDAGTYWLENPLNVKGCALLVPNQYRGVYKIDKHRNKYYALCQRNGEVEVYRDDTKDQILNFDDATKQWGYFGINIHRSNPYSESKNVDKWSAGCQVFKKVNDFNEFMTICNKAREEWSNSFTYTLIKQEDLKL